MRNKYIELNRPTINQYLTKYNGNLNKAIEIEKGIKIDILEVHVAHDIDFNTTIWYKEC